MKTIQILFVSAFLLLSINTITAQYGNGGYGGGGYGGGGYGRGGMGGGMNGMGGGMGSGMSNNRGPDKPKDIPVEETVSKIMLKLTPALTLDALQEIAISNILTESIKSQTAIIKSQISQDQKIKEITVLSENTNSKVKELLSSEQKDKYKAYTEDSKNPKSKNNR